MEIIPIEYCEFAEKFIHLNQTVANCAFEHECGDSEFSCCPLREFFSKNAKPDKSTINSDAPDMPAFYFTEH